MSNAFGVLMAIDEAVTDKLTKLCWWTDKHFGKDNVWWAKATLFLILPLSVVLLKVFSKESEKYSDLFISFFEISLLFVILFYLANKYTFFKEVIINAQNSPNKNRISPVSNLFKMSIAITSIFLPLIPPFSNVNLGTHMIAFLTYEMALYFLCTEPTPPAIKKKKSEEKESKRLQFAN